MQFLHKLNSANYETLISKDASFVLNNVNLIFSNGEDILFYMYIIMLMFSKEIYFNAFFNWFTIHFVQQILCRLIFIK